MKMHELLDSPEKWTKRAYARDAEQVPTIPGDPRAVCWCVQGARIQCYGSADDQGAGPNESEVVRRKLQAAVAAKGGHSRITWWNDAEGRTFGEVRALLLELDV
jgi:hypothetical protein